MLKIYMYIMVLTHDFKYIKKLLYKKKIGEDRVKKNAARLKIIIFSSFSEISCSNKAK